MKLPRIVCLVLILSGGASAPLHAQADLCANATPITGAGLFPFDTRNAGWELGGCSVGPANVFWQWTSDFSGPAVFDVVYPTGSLPFDAIISLWDTDQCDFSNTLISCSDGAWYPTPIRIPSVSAGDTYLIEVSGWHYTWERGTGALRIGPPPCEAGNYSDDAFEPNETLQTAATLSSGTHSGLFLHQNSPDHYSVAVAPGEELVVHVTDSWMESKVTVYDDSLVVAGTSRQYFYFDVWRHSKVIWRPNSPVTVRAKIRVEIETDSLTYPEHLCTPYTLSVTTNPAPTAIQFHCDPANPNSSGGYTHLIPSMTQPGQIPRILTLGAYNGPPGMFGYFIVGSQNLTPGVSVSQGRLCLGGIRGRYNLSTPPLRSTLSFDEHGVRATPFEILNALPIPGMSIQPGDTWYFQLWYRDFGGVSNFSNSVEVNF